MAKAVLNTATPAFEFRLPRSATYDPIQFAFAPGATLAGRTVKCSFKPPGGADFITISDAAALSATELGAEGYAFLSMIRAEAVRVELVGSGGSPSVTVFVD